MVEKWKWTENTSNIFGQCTDHEKQSMEKPPKGIGCYMCCREQRVTALLHNVLQDILQNALKGTSEKTFLHFPLGKKVTWNEPIQQGFAFLFSLVFWHPIHGKSLLWQWRLCVAPIPRGWMQYYSALCYCQMGLAPNAALVAYIIFTPSGDGRVSTKFCFRNWLYSLLLLITSRL